ncbi:PE-PGRS family protein [Streptomyces sp. NPDC048623]|uniref:HEAT repeat domain-containing protein n=1 Tax=Streptomyces sp. NPDC048623 TaxID=3155761 RepID=UPI003448E66A
MSDVTKAPKDTLAGPARDWRGLGGNPVAPDDVLIRLLDVWPQLLYRRDLPVAVIEAAIGHTSWKMRAGLAETRPDLTREQWSRLALADAGDAGGTGDTQRALIVELVADARAPLTPDCLAALAADPSPLVRVEAVRLPGLTAPQLRALAADPDTQVRAAACAPAWPHLEQAVRETLLADSDAQVRTAALLRHHQDVPLDADRCAVLEALGASRERILETCRLAPAWAAELARDGDEPTRTSLALNSLLAPAALALLLTDDDESVRRIVSLRADLTEEQRAGVRHPFRPGESRNWALPWVAELHDDPEAMRRLAASSHPFVRSSVARAPRLPADVVERLARDEDPTVRLFLAESCDDAPGDMLLEVWHWWDGSLSFPGRPRTHPNFPRAGLLRFAADPNPRLRRLALDDPESTPELVETLARDESAEVRGDAARDPRISPGTAVRLLDDPDDGVRLRARRSAPLPLDVLMRLLTDPKTANDASCNPALPLPVMRRMIELMEQEKEQRKATRAAKASAPPRP